MLHPRKDFKVIDSLSMREAGANQYLCNRKIITLLKEQNNQCKHCSTTAIEVLLFYKSFGFDYFILGITPDGNETRMTLDHIVPVSKGGKRVNNLQVLCYECNQKKADKLLDEKIVNDINIKIKEIKNKE